MYEYIKGKLTELTPTYAVIETAGIGYYIHISLFSYTDLQEKNNECKLYIHQVVREDALILYGFFNNKERELFRHLISVSGIGSNTARMMLSSLSPAEIEQAILENDINTLKSIKGIGLKTAQRVILDLKDKVGKSDEGIEKMINRTTQIKEEALSALIALGFIRKNVEKTIDKLLKEKSDLTVEALVKLSLKNI